MAFLPGLFILPQCLLLNNLEVLTDKMLVIGPTWTETGWCPGGLKGKMMTSKSQDHLAAQGRGQDGVSEERSGVLGFHVREGMVEVTDRHGFSTPSTSLSQTADTCSHTVTLPHSHTLILTPIPPPHSHILMHTHTDTYATCSHSRAHSHTHTHILLPHFQDLENFSPRGSV